MWSSVQQSEEVYFLLQLLSNFLVDKWSYIKYHFKFGFGYFLTLMIAGIWTPIFLLRPWDVRNLKYMRHMTKYVPKIQGVRFLTRGVEHIPHKRAAVVVCNHQSTLDAHVVMNLSGFLDAVTVVCKKALFYVWPFGLCVWLAGFIFIDRQQPAKAYNALNGVKDCFKRNLACKLWFFPEGTRNQDVNKTRTLLPFKKGAFRIAIACQIPIIPVVNSPYYFINRDKFQFSPGNAITEVLPPIETTGLTEDDVADLMARTQDIMQHKFDQLCREIDQELTKSEMDQELTKSRTSLE